MLSTLDISVREATICNNIPNSTVIVNAVAIVVGPVEVAVMWH